jgi:biopolymer transport protein ExbB
MRHYIRVFGIVAGLMFFLFNSDILAEDMRSMSQGADQKKQELIRKAQQEKAESLKEQEESRQKIMSDEDLLVSAIAKLKSENDELEKQLREIETQLIEKAEQEKILIEKLSEASSEMRELVGFVRVSARDLEGNLNQSPQNAFFPDRIEVLEAIKNEKKFPDMADIEQMTSLLFEEIMLSGAVNIQKGFIVDRNGTEVEADILMLGNFSAAYRVSSEIGFLLYSDTSKRLFALSKLPGSKHQKHIASYMDGQSDYSPMDISRGGALRQLTHRLSLVEQIPQGGPIVWPIMMILVLGVLIVLERGFFLFRYSINADQFMRCISNSIAEGKWDECQTMCVKHETKAVPKIILAGLQAREMDRQDMENSLQESILKEIPRLEKFLSTLGVLAGIAPLLGLLGTVAGMIETFHVITYFGTGDPRMMSGGISEALVTTMLGLSVAIPLMLCHTLLTRRVDVITAQMEEKAVSLVNTVFAYRNNT